MQQQKGREGREKERGGEDGGGGGERGGGCCWLAGGDSGGLLLGEKPVGLGQGGGLWVHEEVTGNAECGEHTGLQSK